MLQEANGNVDAKTFQENGCIVGVNNASFGIYFPKFIGTIYELLSAPVNFFEIVLGYVGAAATKSLFIGLVIMGTSTLFVEFNVIYPGLMILFLVLTCVSFALLGFIDDLNGNWWL